MTHNQGVAIRKKLYYSPFCAITGGFLPLCALCQSNQYPLMCSYASRTEMSKKYLSAVSNLLILPTKTLKPNQKPLIDKPTGTHSPKKYEPQGGYPCKIKQASVFCHFILGNKNPALKFQQGMSKCNFTLSGSLRPHQTTKIKKEREQNKANKQK